MDGRIWICGPALPAMDREVPLCQRSCRPDRIKTSGGAGRRTWLGMDRRLRTTRWQRLLPPQSCPVEALSARIGIGAGTLERWRAEALARAADNKGNVPSRWTASGTIVRSAFPYLAWEGRICGALGPFGVDVIAPYILKENWFPVKNPKTPRSSKARRRVKLNIFQKLVWLFQFSWFIIKRRVTARVPLSARRPIQLSAQQHIQRGDFHLAYGRNALGMHAYLKAYEASPDDMSLRRQIGVTAFLTGDYSDAEFWFASITQYRSLLLQRLGINIEDFPYRILDRSWMLAIGHVAFIDTYIKATKLGWYPEKITILAYDINSLPPGWPLLRFFGKYITLVAVEGNPDTTIDSLLFDQVREQEPEQSLDALRASAIRQAIARAKSMVPRQSVDAPSQTSRSDPAETSPSRFPEMSPSGSPEASGSGPIEMSSGGPVTIPYDRTQQGIIQIPLQVPRTSTEPEKLVPYNVPISWRGLYTGNSRINRLPGGIYIETSRSASPKEPELRTYDQRQRSIIRSALSVDFWSGPDSTGRTRWFAPWAAAVETAWKASGRSALYGLEPGEREAFRRLMAQAYDLPEDAWYVLLHVREPGFHAGWHKKHPGTRNADIGTYDSVIDFVLSRGGWVVRGGDPTMKPIHPRERVIDYANGAFRSPEIDVLLCADCAYFVGTNSGYSVLPPVFGKRCALTNWSPIGIPNWYLDDIYIPKLIRDKRQERYLTFQEMYSSFAGWSQFERDFKRTDLTIEDNSPDDLLDAVMELHAEVFDEPRDQTAEDEARLQRFNEIALANGGYIGSRMSSNFLRSHADLLGQN